MEHGVKFEVMAEEARGLAAAYRVTDGRGFSLADRDPADTGPFSGDQKTEAKRLLGHGVMCLAELQERLYAQDRRAALLIFQAMDAAGKDSAIKHVMSGVNPQGCQVYSFGRPSEEERDHDFLWRCAKRMPERGRIGIFNRSYYEETLIVRVHTEILEAQKLPPKLVSRRIWKERFQDITSYEQYLARNGVAICKFFLHVSAEEQKRRFLKRLSAPEKHWKFSEADVAEREHWEAYQRAYEETIRATATEHAPWYAIPADHKWFTRLVVAAAVIDLLSGLGLEYRTVSDERKADLERARRELEGE
jgi:PPK2 family polyphosphate:nucleotide phosphotransferase